MTEPANLADLTSGLTPLQLSSIFGMSVETVRQRLAKCPVAGTRNRGAVYDLATAAAYLVKPAIDLEEYLASIRIEDLPLRLQKEYWATLERRFKVEEGARHLWRSEDVLDALALIWSTVKSTIQLWPDTINRQVGLSEEQWKILMDLGDSLQEQTYQAVLEAVRDRTTRPEFDRWKAETNRPPEVEDIL